MRAFGNKYQNSVVKRQKLRQGVSAGLRVIFLWLLVVLAQWWQNLKDPCCLEHNGFLSARSAFPTSQRPKTCLPKNNDSKKREPHLIPHPHPTHAPPTLDSASVQKSTRGVHLADRRFRGGLHIYHSVRVVCAATARRPF